jgi:hypothetical protein
MAVREQFARVLAEELDRVELAAEQLELLLGLPEPPPNKAAEWLALLAAWQLQRRNNRAAARQLLERLIHDYPQSAPAFSAQRRLNLMAVEDRLRRRP